jgi:hypothetical protein
LLNSDLIQVEQYSSASTLLAATERRRKRERARATPKRCPPKTIEELNAPRAEAKVRYRRPIGPIRPPRFIEPVTPSDMRQMAEEAARIANMGENYCPSMARIERLVCRVMGVTRKELRGGGKEGSLVVSRALISNMTRRYTDRTFPQIGRFLNLDHTSVIHHCRHYERTKAKWRGRSQTVRNRNRMHRRRMAKLAMEQDA